MIKRSFFFIISTTICKKYIIIIRNDIKILFQKLVAKNLLYRYYPVFTKYTIEPTSHH